MKPQIQIIKSENEQEVFFKSLNEGAFFLFHNHLYAKMASFQAISMESFRVYDLDEEHKVVPLSATIVAFAPKGKPKAQA